MNHKNLDHLIDWLDRGAPEVLFSMNHGFSVIEDVQLQDLLADGDVSDDQLHKTACGSICCIAGAAAQFSGKKPMTLMDSDWEDIQRVALKWLGLPKTNVHMLPVFDPSLAPDFCSPKEAAEALRKWAPEAAQGNLDFNPWSN